MNNRRKELLELARRAANRFQADNNVRALIVTGSVARGNADAVSDVDIILFLAEALSEEAFQAERSKAETSGGGFYGGSAAEGFGVYHFIEGIKVDFGFAFVKDTDSLLEDVLIRHDTDLDKQLIIGGIRQSIPLKGESIIAGWKERTDTYPEELGRTMVKQYLGATPLAVLKNMGADREDRLFMVERFVESINRLLGVLFGLNRVYHPGKLKGARDTLRALDLTPPNLSIRLESLFSLPPRDAVLVYKGLMEETFTLVDKHMPGLDTTAARARFAMKLNRQEQH